MAAQTVLSNVNLPAVNITRRYDYDHAGRVIEERHPDINGVEKKIGADYWPNGAVKKKYLGDGSATGVFTYDLAGALSSIGNLSNTGTPVNYIDAISYNLRGQTAAIDYGNSTSSAFTYDAARGWLNRIKTLQGATEIVNLNYVRNLNGQIRTVTSATGDVSYDGPRSWVVSVRRSTRLGKVWRCSSTATSLRHD